MKYFLLLKGKVTGPFDKDKVIALIHGGIFAVSGRISSDSKKWTEIKSHPDFKNHFKTNAIQLNYDEHELASYVEEKVLTKDLKMKKDEPEVWRVFRNKKNYGPYTREEMELLFNERRISASDYIRASSDQEWKLADSLFSFSTNLEPETVSERPGEMPNEKIRLRMLIPFENFIDISLFKKDFVRLIIFIAVIPMIICYLPSLLSSHNMVELNRYIFSLWGIYFCIIWAGAFALVAKPSKAIWKKGVCFAVFTAIVGVPLLLAAQKVPIISDFYSMLGQNQQEVPVFRRLTGFILGVGVCEEFFKALPLLLFTGRTNANKSEFIFLGMMSGFGFAIAENIDYSFQVIGGAVNTATVNSNGESDLIANIFMLYGGIISTQLVRYISLPILHASWSGVLGWFIATSKAYPQKGKLIILSGICAMAFLHGIYDFACGFDYMNIPVMIAVFLVFCAYISYTEEDKMNLNNNIKFSS